MSDYKVIYRKTIADEGMPWEPGCPLAISAIQIARNTITATCYLQLKFLNISNQFIEKLEGSANIIYADGTSEDIDFAFLDADIKPQKYYQPPALLLKGSEPTSVHVEVKRIKTPNTSWESSGVSQEFPSPSNLKSLELSTAAYTERRKQLEELHKSPGTLYYSAQDHDSWWICSCGAVNVGREKCHSCLTSKDKILQLQDEAKLEQDAQEREVKLEQDAQMRAAELKKKQHTKKRVVVSVAIAAVVAITAIAIYVTGAYHYPEYLKATALKDEGNYSAAYITFETLNDFMDSRQQTVECEQKSEELISAAIKDNPILGKNIDSAINNYRLTRSAKDQAKIYLFHSGRCMITTRTEEHLVTVEGSWAPSDDYLFVANFPDFGGEWKGEAKDNDTRLILTCVKDRSRKYEFPLKPVSE